MVKKILASMNATRDAGGAATEHVDLDGSGRPDLVLWQVSGKIEWKTDLSVFLRDQNHELAATPAQMIHCSGFPIPLGETESAWPVADLKHDGHFELVLLEFNTTVLSASGVVQTMLSRGLDWSLTIRPFQHGAFSRFPVTSVPLTMTMPGQFLDNWPICIAGDFNGDGRPDLLVRRTDTQWNILPSTADGHWFAPQPAMTFESPASGWLEVVDLRGNGISDIVWHDPNHHTLSIYLSPPRPAKGNNP